MDFCLNIPLPFSQIVPEHINPGAKAPQQNVQPGTVVDKGVMNAALTEFLLVGHKALQASHPHSLPKDHFYISPTFRERHSQFDALSSWNIVRRLGRRQGFRVCHWKNSRT
jgi:hypothetical protein